MHLCAHRVQMQCTKPFTNHDRLDAADFFECVRAGAFHIIIIVFVSISTRRMKSLDCTSALVSPNFFGSLTLKRVSSLSSRPVYWHDIGVQLQQRHQLPFLCYCLLVFLFNFHFPFFHSFSLSFFYLYIEAYHVRCRSV